MVSIAPIHLIRHRDFSDENLMAPAGWRQSKSTNFSVNDSRLDWHCVRRIGNHGIRAHLFRLMVKSFRFGSLAVKFPFLNVTIIFKLLNKTRSKVKLSSFMWKQSYKRKIRTVVSFSFFRKLIVIS